MKEEWEYVFCCFAYLVTFMFIYCRQRYGNTDNKNTHEIPMKYS